jgi:hypothetical protein
MYPGPTMGELQQSPRPPQQQVFLTAPGQPAILSQHTTPLAPIPVSAQLYAAHRQHQLQQQAHTAYGAQQQQEAAQSPWNSWQGAWDQQSLASFFNTMTLQQPQSITEWIADSGASNHTTPDSGNISRYRSPTSTIPSSIVVGNGSSLPVSSVGDTMLSGQFYLNNVLVTPDIIKNLLSVCQFTTDNNCSMEFDPFGLFVKDLNSRNTILRCNSSGPLYTISLPTTRAPPATTHYALVAVAAPASLWHQRLGHPGPDVLAKLSSIAAVSCNKPKHVPICHACQLGRHTRLPFAQSMSHATQCFDLVHCDLWTSPIISVSGFKYYLVILDDFDIILGLFLCASNLILFPPSLIFFSYVHTQFGRMTKQVQCDNGREFDNSSTRTFFLHNGVKLHMSCPYTSPQNGKAERMLHTTNNMIHILLLQASMAPHYWVDALHTSTYLLNCLPTKTVCASCLPCT